jgi:hypothetical protein
MKDSFVALFSRIAQSLVVFISLSVFLILPLQAADEPM